MAKLEARDISSEVLKIFGLENQNVKRITINIEVDEVVTMNVTRYVREEELGELIEVFDKYHLVKDENDEKEKTTKLV